jgi:hypothetical protein
MFTLIILQCQLLLALGVVAVGVILIQLSVIGIDCVVHQQLWHVIGSVLLLISFRILIRHIDESSGILLIWFQGLFCFTCLHYLPSFALTSNNLSFQFVKSTLNMGFHYRMSS